MKFFTMVLLFCAFCWLQSCMQMPEQGKSQQEEGGGQMGRGGGGMQGGQGAQGGFGGGQGRGPGMQQQFAQAMSASFSGQMNVYEDEDGVVISDGSPPTHGDQFHQQDREGNHFFLPPFPHGDPRTQCQNSDTIGVAVDGTPIKGGLCNQDKRFRFSMDVRSRVQNRPGEMLGVLADGTPVYGPSRASNLDENGGHFGKTLEFPEGSYHIHLEISGDTCKN